MTAGGTRPAVSPNGRLVAFSAAPSGTWDVYLANIDGTGKRRLTTFGEKSFTSLSPATWVGDRLFMTRRVGDTTRAFVLDADGRATATIVMPSDARQIRPSPDGRRIVFVHGTARNAHVAIGTIDGANVSDVRDVAGGAVGALNPDWSRDGRRIAFTLVDSASGAQIAIVDPDAGSVRLLTKFDQSEGMPQWSNWSPDGRRLAIQAGKYNPQHIEESTAHLWIVDVATGRVTKLAPHERLYLDETPAWFPDGSRIAFQSNRSGTLEIWTMKPDGTDARQLTGLR